MYGTTMKIKNQVSTAGSGQKETLEKSIQRRLWVTWEKVIYVLIQWRPNPEIAAVLDFLLGDIIINSLLFRPVDLGFSVIFRQKLSKRKPKWYVSFPIAEGIALLFGIWY